MHTAHEDIRHAKRMLDPQVDRPDIASDNVPRSSSYVATTRPERQTRSETQVPDFASCLENVKALCRAVIDDLRLFASSTTCPAEPSQELLSSLTRYSSARGSIANDARLARRHQAQLKLAPACRARSKSRCRWLRTRSQPTAATQAPSDQAGAFSVGLDAGERVAHHLAMLPRAGIAGQRREEFLRWFGRSKVVDEANNPKIVYHGTTKGFDVFQTRKRNPELGFTSGLSLRPSGLRRTTRSAARCPEQYQAGLPADRASSSHAGYLRASVHSTETALYWLYREGLVCKPDCANVCRASPRGTRTPFSGADRSARYDGIVYKNDQEGGPADSNEDSYAVFCLIRSGLRSNSTTAI